MATVAASRGILGWALDYVAAWYFGLPSEQNGYTVETVEIPVRDGVVLLADLYRPVGVESVGTVLAVGPYGRGVAIAAGTVRLYASRGYHGLLVSVRGTFGSGGSFAPGETSADDAHDIAVWMREQSWYTGSFATVGNSYLGLTQWAMLESEPKDMAAAIVGVGPHDLSEYLWGTGTLNLDLISWAGLVTEQEDLGFFRAHSRLVSSRERLRDLFMATPLADASDKHFAGKAPWLRERLTRSNIKDPFWRSQQHFGAVERANLPILLVSGWHDVFIKQTMRQYRTLQGRGVDVAMTIGPWNHITVSQGTQISETYQWLEQHMADRQVNSRESPVRIHVGGANEWRNLPSWPPRTHAQELYLHPRKRLYEVKPPARADESTFTFDPDHPTPAVGGPRIATDKSVIDTAFEKMSDVLTFTTDELQEDVEVLGPCSVELSHASDNPHADLFVRISDVDEKGVSRYIAQVYQRLDPFRGDEPVTLTLPDCAHRFKVGHAIRLVIAGGCHPHYARNLGVDSKNEHETTTRPATHIIRHAGKQVSKLIMPVARM